MLARQIEAKRRMQQLGFNLTCLGLTGFMSNIEAPWAGALSSHNRRSCCRQLLLPLTAVASAEQPARMLFGPQGRRTTRFALSWTERPGCGSLFQPLFTQPPLLSCAARRVAPARPCAVVPHARAQHGLLPLCAPRSQAPWISTEDIGNAVAQCFAMGPAAYGKDICLVCACMPALSTTKQYFPPAERRRPRPLAFTHCQPPLIRLAAPRTDPLASRAADIQRGDDVAAIVSKIRGYPVKYKSLPALALRIFVPEFYLMKTYFDRNVRVWGE